jgi:regulator of sigma E protease
MSSAWAITAFVVALLLAILIHELGHLLTAKAVGMKADRYFVGSGRRCGPPGGARPSTGSRRSPWEGSCRSGGCPRWTTGTRPCWMWSWPVTRLIEDAAGDDTPVVTFADGTPTLTAGTFLHLEEELATSGRRRRRGSTSCDADGRPSPTSTGRDRPARPPRDRAHTEVGPSRRRGDLAWRLERGDEGRFYHDRPAWQRALAIVMGPITHLVIAFGLLFGLYVLLMLPTGEVTTEIGAVIEGSAAADTELRAGDRLLAVDDVASDRFEVLRDAIRERPDQADDADGAA